MIRRIKQNIKKVKKLIFADSSKRAIRLITSYPNTSVGSNVLVGDYFSFDGNSHSFNLSIENDVRFNTYCHILMQGTAVLDIKQGVFFNNYCSINCLDKIEIGENTLFGEGVKLYDHNHEFISSPQVLISRSNFKTGPITIGKNCWIGSNVTILKGVTIGDNVIIGANNLIYKSVPSNCIVKNKQELIIDHFGDPSS